MEIIDFIRGRWLLLAVTAPVLAGMIAFIVISGIQSERYEATGSISVSQAVPGDLPAQNLRVYVESLVASVESTETARAVNAELGTTLAEVDAVLTVEPSVADRIALGFVAGSSERARTGLDVAARSGLFDFLQRQRQRVALTVDVTRSRVRSLADEIAVIEAEVGVQDVSAEFRNLSSDILSLRNQVASAAVTQPTVGAALQELLDEKQAERTRLGAVLGEYERVRGALDDASEALRGAEAELARIDGLVGAVRGGDVVSSLDVRAQSSFAATVRATLAAVVGAFGAVIVGAVLVNRRSQGTGMSASALYDDSDELDMNGAHSTTPSVGAHRRA